VPENTRYASSGEPHITGEQLRAARALVDWLQAELAKRSKVRVETIRRMESFSGPIGCLDETLEKVTKVLEAAGVEFLNGEFPGVRLKSTRPARQR
jgi:transcriptional regulator with XRE-family HTH domain